MAAQVMKEGKVQMVVVGADRIASNGDTANKIGTYGVALLAKAHGIPFYVAAPSSTFDMSIPDGSAIPIEQRDPREITHGFGRQTAPDGVDVYNPAFDVTPAELIAGIITEKGIIRPVDRDYDRRRCGAVVTLYASGKLLRRHSGIIHLRWGEGNRGQPIAQYGGLSNQSDRSFIDPGPGIAIPWASDRRDEKRNCVPVFFEW